MEGEGDKGGTEEGLEYYRKEEREKEERESRSREKKWTSPSAMKGYW